MKSKRSRHGVRRQTARDVRMFIKCAPSGKRQSLAFTRAVKAIILILWTQDAPAQVHAETSQLNLVDLGSEQQLFETLFETTNYTDDASQSVLMIEVEFAENEVALIGGDSSAIGRRPDFGLVLLAIWSLLSFVMLMCCCWRRGEPKAKQSRTVSTQSQTTYSQHLVHPRFSVLPEALQGVFTQTPAHQHEPKAKQSRTVSTQSQTTYSYHLMHPRFSVLPEALQGVFTETPAHQHKD